MGSPNLDAADAALGLTPQERALYERHLTNLYGPGGVNNPDGSRSTLFQLSFGRDGKTYNVPTVYDGRILQPDEAIARAESEGLDKFPSYGSEAEAEDRYQKMHDFMERDTGAYLNSRSKPPMGLFNQLNPFSQSALDLNQYVQAARPQVARMLGMGVYDRSNQWWNPSPNGGPRVGPFPINPTGADASGGPPMDFNQSFGALPTSSPADKASFLAKFLQARQPGPPLDLSPPNPGPTQFAGGPQNTSGGVTPQPTDPGFSDDFMGRFAKMGSESGAGLIPKFAYLAGLGRNTGVT